MATSSYDFTRRPKWIAGHILALTGIVTFVALGFWQLARLEQRRTTNARIEARLEATPVSLDQAIAADGPSADDLEYRRVSAVGQYVVSDQVLLRAQAFNGAPGFHVLTPLLLEDGTALIVDRGWIPLAAQGRASLYAPVGGSVAAEGIVRRTQVRGSFGPTDPSEGELDVVSRVDVERLSAQTTQPLRSYYLELVGQDPEPADLPRLLSPPVLDEGPHLGYAIQWFSFAGVVLIGYPILLRTTASRKDSPRRGDGGRRATGGA